MVLNFGNTFLDPLTTQRICCCRVPGGKRGGRRHSAACVQRRAAPPADGAFARALAGAARVWNPVLCHAESQDASTFGQAAPRAWCKKHPCKPLARAHCCSGRHILKRTLPQMLRRVRGHRLTSPNVRKPLRMMPRGEQTFLTTFSRRLTPSTLRARAPSEHACRTSPHRCLLCDCTIFAWGPSYPGTF